jgi:acyl carrier protein phosphodiesterase
MNFLAHFHLAWPDEGLIAGGLEGDYCKGPLRGELPQGVENGVKLHRAIDAYTDNHPLVAQLRHNFPRELRRYAGILIDLSFDHYLSLHWDRFADMPLGEFNRAVYRALDRQQAELSQGSQGMIARLVKHDILGIYHNWETVPATAAHIGRRFKRENPLRDVNGQLSPIRQEIETAFLEFYPQLQVFSKNQQLQLNRGAFTESNIALAAKNP